ncbi:MAG: EpsG family protein [Snowella sp.]|nr:EpsG family protein [Snowella sp.]
MKKYSAFLIFSLLVWFIIPIIGIFFLLWWIQLSLLNQNHRNSVKSKYIINLILVLIVLTLTIFSSSMTVYSDTRVYVNDYLNWRDFNSLFNLPPYYGYGLEFVLPLISLPVHYFSNASPYWFIFNQSLIFNILVTFVISKKISIKYYPILLVLVFSSIFYYYHVFMMRQILSLVFFMAAVVNIESVVPFILFVFLSLFSHLSSIPSIIILILFKFKLLLDKKINHFSLTDRLLSLIRIILPPKSLIGNRTLSKIFIVFTVSLIVILGSDFNNVIYLFTFLSKRLNSLALADFASSKGESYGDLNNFKNNFWRGIGLLFYANFFVLAVIIFFKKTFSSNLSRLLVLLFITQFGQFILLFINPNLLFRIILLSIVFQGFFFILALEEKKHIYRRYVYFSSLLSVLYFSYWLSNMPNVPPSSGGVVVFWKGEVFTKNIWDYIHFLINSRTN